MTAITVAARTARGQDRGRLLALAWVTWRQHRVALAGISTAALALAITMIVSGLRIHDTFAPFVAGHCGTSWHASPCGTVARSIAGYQEAGVQIALHVLPVVIAVFLGAPVIAREAEAGTTQFAWTQAAGRTRWLLARLVLLGGFVIVVCAALGALAGWWLHPFEAVGDSSRWQSDFGVTPLLLAAWGLLGLTFGVLAGALTRRVIAAIAAAGAGMTGIIIAFVWKLDSWVFSVAPLTARGVPWSAEYSAGGWPVVGLVNGWPQISLAGRGSGDWLVRGQITGPGGRPLTGAAADRVNGALYGGFKPAVPHPIRWLAVHHDTFTIAYQPAARFWPFQLGLATAVVLAAVLACLATARLVRRLG